MKKSLADIKLKKKAEKIFFPVSFSKSREKKNQKFELFKKISFLFIFFLVCGTLLFFFFTQYFSKVQITVSLKKETFEIKDQVILSSKIQNLDFKSKKIPAEIFEEEKVFSLQVPASGVILKKAEGKIRLYNSYTTKEETWVAGTRFLSSDNKIFLSKSKITVPGATIKDGKIEPSFVDVEVIAAEGGEEYNIGPTKFSIPAFKGSERYYKYYGESLEPMKGGGKKRVVKKEDIENGFNVLISQIEKEKGKEFIKERISSNVVFPEDLVLVEVLEKKSNQKEGDEVPNFSVSVKAKIKTFLVKKENLLSFVQALKSFYQPPSTKLLSQNENLQFESLTRDFEKGEVLVNLNYRGELILRVEKDELKKAIAGKRIKEIEEILKNKAEIEKVKIRVSPFWVFKVPENFDKIEIQFEGID